MKRLAIAALAAALAGAALAAEETVGRKPEPEDELPALLGIEQTGLRETKWGIVNAVTPYRDAATGAVAGKTGVGSVFVVEKFQKAEVRGYDYVGHFRSRPAEGPFLISAARVYGLSGSFDKLSPHQQKVFAAYYRVRAACEKLRQDFNRRNGEKSPYYQDAVEAKTKFDEMAAEVERLEGQLMGSATADASAIREKLSRMKGEVSVQRGRLKELSDKHKERKEKHAGAMLNPDADPRIKAMREEMNDYRQIIPGLAI